MAKSPSRAKRASYTIADKQYAVKQIKKYSSLNDAVVHLQKQSKYKAIDAGMLSRWREKHGSSVLISKMQARVRKTRNTPFPRLEAACNLWCETREAKGQPITARALCSRALRLSKAMGITEAQFKASEGWAQRFLARNEFTHKKVSGEAKSANIADVSAERERLQALLAGWDHCNILNADEFGSFYRQDNAWTYAKGSAIGRKQDKSRITVLAICSASGEKFPLIYIGKAAKPRCFNSRSPNAFGYQYYNNAAAWMTRNIFEDIMIRLNATIKAQDPTRKVLLLLDNFSGHKISETCQDKLTNIQIEMFAPNLTAYVQPCDAGIIRATKAHYQRLKMERSLDREDEGNEDIFRMELSDGLGMLKDAWAEISSTTIKNCWRHTNILPGSLLEQDISTLTPDAAVTRAVEGVQASVRDLKAALDKRKGARANAPKPALPTADELMADIPDADIPDDISDNGLLALVDDVQAIDVAEVEVVKPARHQLLAAAQTLLKAAHHPDYEQAFDDVRRGLRTLATLFRREEAAALADTTLDAFFTASPALATATAPQSDSIMISEDEEDGDFKLLSFPETQYDGAQPLINASNMSITFKAAMAEAALRYIEPFGTLNAAIEAIDTFKAPEELKQVAHASTYVEELIQMAWCQEDDLEFDEKVQDIINRT